MMYDEIGKGINPYGLDYPVCLETKFRYEKNKHAETAPVSMSESPVDSAYALVDAKTGHVVTDSLNTPINPKVALSTQATQLLNHSAVSYGDVINAAPPFTPPEDTYYPCQSNHLAANLIPTIL